MDEFSYIASHDLKEPMRGVYNHAKFLIEDHEDILPEDALKRLNRIITLSDRMEKLAADLLYFSRIGRSDLAKKRTDLNAVVREVEESMDAFDGQKRTIKIAGVLPTVVCDGLRLTEVFRNLIKNALKYNESDQKEVEIGVEKGQDNRDVFYVSDNGIGISEKYHDDVFCIFKRLHKKEAYGGGTGSGLTFVQKIVTRHNGEIWIEPSLKMGRSFVLLYHNHKETKK